MDDAIFDCVSVVKFNNESKNNRKTSLNSKVASNLALRVSWLKFEPWSRISPCKISHFRGSFYCCYSREFFFLFLLDKNDILTFVITYKVETTKENGIMFYQMVRWQKILLLMDTN